MRIISKKPLRDFWDIYPDSKSALEDWLLKANQMAAKSFSEVRQTFNSADYVDGFTIFNVGGNKYRIAAVIHYDKQRLYVRQVMTHSEYDRNDWRKNESKY